MKSIKNKEVCRLDAAERQRMDVASQARARKIHASERRAARARQAKQAADLSLSLTLAKRLQLEEDQAGMRRDGESLNALNIDEIGRIRAQSTEEDWSIKICDEATIYDLSKEAIQKAKELYVQKNPKFITEVSNWNDETFLNKAKITIKSKITNTAILLLQPEMDRMDYIAIIFV